VSPKLGARYLVNDDIQVFGNVSGSFEPPSFGELSGGQVINVVRAQEATSFEIGTRGQHDLLATSWDIVYYYADVDDELLSLNDELGQPLGTVSADSTIHQGIELGLRNTVGPLDIRQIYLWNDFIFDNDPVFSNNDLAGVPEHYYRGEFLVNLPRDIFVGPVIEWVPSDYYVDHANTLEADSYAIVGLKGGLRTDNGLHFFIEGRNIFDKTYAATTGVIADAGGTDSAQFLPGDGASVFVGIEWEFTPDR
jgi:iron complex outermembrane receptor protein